MMGFPNPLETVFAIKNTGGVSKDLAIEAFIIAAANEDNPLTKFAKVAAPTAADANAFRILGMSALPSAGSLDYFVNVFPKSLC